MNRKGKQEQNNEAVFKLLSKATKLDDESYIFIDLANNIYLVNTDGSIFIVDDDVITPCNSFNKFPIERLSPSIRDKIFIRVNSSRALFVSTYGCNKLAALT